VGHHGGRGMMMAAMVHRVLLIDMCLVLDLCIGMVLTYRGGVVFLFHRKIHRSNRHLSQIITITIFYVCGV